MVDSYAHHTARRPADQCIWPGCKRPKAITPEDPGQQICRWHMVDAWEKICQEHAKWSGRKLPRQHPEPPPEVPRNEQPGYIYYLEIGPYIKIGWASDLFRRLAQYPPNRKLLTWHRGTLKEEQRIHSLLTVNRAHGREWYHPNAEVMAFLEEAKLKRVQVDGGG